MTRLEFIVEPAEAGSRLDSLVIARKRGLGRKAVADLFAAGSVMLDGSVARKGDRARSGCLLRVELDEFVAAQSPKEEQQVFARADTSLSLDVRLERDDLIVVHKPPGQPTAPLDGQEIGTLANALVARYPELRGFGHSPLEPGLVNRLDTGTSGLLLVGRDPGVFAALTERLRGGTLQKRYLALVVGTGLSERGEIDLPLAPHPKSARRVIACTPGLRVRGARPAHTAWRVIEEKLNLTLLELDVCRASRHQIRAHLAYLKHPILGDRVYGAGPHSLLGLGHALHASFVGWGGDSQIPAFSVDAAPPSSWAAVLSGADSLHPPPTIRV